MRWTIAQVADALGSRPGTGLNPLARVAGVSIDSRAIRAGELFIAIHGPRHDGHDHVASALEAGAVAAVGGRVEVLRYGDPLRGRGLGVGGALLAPQQIVRPGGGDLGGGKFGARGVFWR